ncbi:MAG: Hpt domain-containing protein [Nitrospiraceae bacterium]|jgi:HPt (histidine-containing phosphotransfer) domain-containing protein
MTIIKGSDAQARITVYLDPDLEDIVPGFLENRRKDVETITSCVEKNDLATIRILGHRMKGDGGGYGFDSISTIGEVLEQAALRRDHATIRERINELANFLRRVEVVYKR